MLALIIFFTSCESVSTDTAATDDPAPNETSYTHKWDWETHGAAKAFSWYRIGISIALPEAIRDAKLKPATVDEIRRDDSRCLESYGDHWEPFTRFYQEGDTVWHWVDKNEKSGYLIKREGAIYAWRFRMYGPY